VFRKAIKAILSLAAACMVAAPGGACIVNSVSFSFDAQGHAASATFVRSGNNLVVTLSNTSTQDVLQPTDLLTAVFFDVAGHPALTPSSAVLTPGSDVLFGKQPVGGNVGGEWAFVGSLSGAPGCAKYGISATGLSLFGPHDLFPGPNLNGPTNVGGMDFGLLSSGDNPRTGNKPVTGQNPLISNSVTFTLSGLPACLNFNGGISNVWFQYGTSRCEPVYKYSVETSPAPVPEPVMLGTLVMGLGWIAIRTKRRLGNTAMISQ